MTPKQRQFLIKRRKLQIAKLRLLARLNEITLQKGMIDSLLGDIKEHPALLEM
jgi:hypothetical protein